MKKKQLELVFESREEWLKHRMDGIGASDAPIVLGQSKYKKPQQLFEEKVGLVSPPPVNNFAIRRGIELEPIARQKFSARYNFIHDLKESFEASNVVHPVHQFMRASLDGISLDKSLIIEIKFQGAEWHFKGGHEQIVRPDYFTQIQHQLFVSQAKRGILVSINKDHHIAAVTVERDEEYILHILEACTKFWQDIVDFKNNGAGSCISEANGNG